MPIKHRNIIDRKILEFIDILKSIGEIEVRQEFMDLIGMKKQNFTKILAGEMSFTMNQFIFICDHWNLNANWFLDKEKELFKGRQTKGQTKQTKL